MGFMWSKPESPLKANLLDEEPELILRTGDIMLVPTPELDVFLDAEQWSKVGIVVHNENKVFVFCDGKMQEVFQFLIQFPDTVCRPLTCIREMGFDRRVMKAVERTTNILLKRPRMNPMFREGFCVGTFLGIMALVDWKVLVKGKLRPSHFSVENNTLQLHEYSTEQFKVVY